MRCTVELTCIYVPAGPRPGDIERAEETALMWERARGIADALGVPSSFEVNLDHGDRVGDAYLYPDGGVLETLLAALDGAGCGFDNIDLPAGAPPDLLARLRAKYPWVNQCS